MYTSRAAAFLMVGVMSSVVVSIRGAAAQAPSSASQKGVRVSGVVELIRPDLPVRPANVILTPPFDAPGRLELFLRAPIGTDNRFVFEGIRPGRYRLTVDRGSGSEVEIEVGNRDVTGVRLIATGLTPFDVTVRTNDGSPVPDSVRYTAVEAGRQAIGFLGRTQLWVSPGQLQLFVTPPAGYFLVALRSGGTDLLTESLQIAPGDPARNLEVILSRTASSSRPTANLLGRMAVSRPGAEIELANEGAAINPFAPVVARTRVDDTGNFVFRGISPGVYQINVPPAQRVLTKLPVLAGDVRVEVPVPAGTLFAIAPVPLVESDGARGYRRGASPLCSKPEVRSRWSPSTASAAGARSRQARTRSPSKGSAPA